MSKSLSLFIESLMELDSIKSKTAHLFFLISTNKYFSADSWKAYLLGYFFKQFYSLDNLPPKLKKQFAKIREDNSLKDFFSLSKKPEKDSLAAVYIVLFFGGLIPIIIGIRQMLDGYIWYGSNLLYDIPVVKEGGFKIIVGLGLSIAGGINLNKRRKMRDFLKLYSIN